MTRSGTEGLTAKLVAGSRTLGLVSDVTEERALDTSDAVRALSATVADVSDPA